MPAIDVVPPLEFVIPQRPVSQQARRQARLREWRETVAEHARLAIVEPRTLATEPVALRLLYIYDEAALDVDNILKILDALIGVLFEDDSVITDVRDPTAVARDDVHTQCNVTGPCCRLGARPGVRVRSVQ